MFLFSFSHNGPKVVNFVFTAFKGRTGQHRLGDGKQAASIQADAEAIGGYEKVVTGDSSSYLVKKHVYYQFAYRS